MDVVTEGKNRTFANRKGACTQRPDLRGTLIGEEVETDDGEDGAGEECGGGDEEE
jgi:hypothetical protein